MDELERLAEAVKPVAPLESVGEEAEFWDNHLVVDVIDKGTLVDFHHSRKSGTPTSRFRPEDVKRLREEAHKRGVGPTNLVRIWVLEHLRGLKAPSSAP